MHDTANHNNLHILLTKYLITTKTNAAVPLTRIRLQPYACSMQATVRTPICNSLGQDSELHVWHTGWLKSQHHKVCFDVSSRKIIQRHALVVRHAHQAAAIGAEGNCPHLQHDNRQHG